MAWEMSVNLGRLGDPGPITENAEMFLVRSPHLKHQGVPSMAQQSPGGSAARPLGGQGLACLCDRSHGAWAVCTELAASAEVISPVVACMVAMVLQVPPSKFSWTGVL